MQIIPADLQSIGGRRVSESEVVHPLRHANVVDDEVAIAGGNDLADLVLGLLEDALGGFDTGRRRGADVELEHVPPKLSMGFDEFTGRSG